MWEFFLDLGRALAPHPESGEPAHVFKWRQTVAISIIGVWIVLMLHIAAASGWLMLFGIQGYAVTGDLKTSQNQLLEIRLTQIDRAIKEAKAANCLAAIDGNMAALEFSLKDLNERLADYYRAANRPYLRVPECTELIAVRR